MTTADDNDGKATAWSRLCASVEKCAKAVVGHSKQIDDLVEIMEGQQRTILDQKDCIAFAFERCRVLEDRLAKVDDGNDAHASLRAAQFAINAQRISNGDAALRFRLDADGLMVWDKGRSP